MASTISTDNQTLGRGEVHFATYDPDTDILGGFRYVGNTPSFGVTVRSQMLDHFNDDKGIRRKDKSIPLRIDYSASLTMDDIQPENLALYFSGESLTVVNPAIVNQTEAIAAVLPGYGYQLGFSDANPSGVRQITEIEVTVSGQILAAGTDYSLDSIRGILTFSQTVELGASATIVFSAAGYAEDRVISGSKTVLGAIRFLSFNPEGAQMDWFMPLVCLSSTDEFSFKSDRWQQMSFTASILAPVGRSPIYINGTAVPKIERGLAIAIGGTAITINGSEIKVG